MSTFDGVVQEFPEIRIDNFLYSSGSPPPLAYFLSHVHTDHTKGLETYRSPAFIYCSAATKSLLLRMEKFPNRTYFDEGILEAKQLHFRHLKAILRPLPVNTPTKIQLTPGKHITVTLFDANHCPGAVMFLIEKTERRVLYTGDIRAEDWWIEALLHQPAMIAYSAGHKRLDNLYLDTTYTNRNSRYSRFPNKASGMRSLVRQIAQHSEDTIFHLKSWTFGYEEVWATIAATFSSKIHVDRYRSHLYSSLSSLGDPTVQGEVLDGFYIGSMRHSGILTTAKNSRFHACQPQCDEVLSSRTIHILPVVSPLLEELGVPVRYTESSDSGQERELAPNQIVFPFARHSSYDELCHLVKALNPKDIYPCTFDEENWSPEYSMRTLFGHVCNAKTFAIDEEMLEKYELSHAEEEEEEASHSQQLNSLVSYGGSSLAFDYSEIDITLVEGVVDGESFTSPPQRKGAVSIRRGFELDGNVENGGGKRQKQLKHEPDEVPSSDAEDETIPESQLTLPDSAFANDDSQLSQTSSVIQRKLLNRQEAYRAACKGDGSEWANNVCLHSMSTGEEIEL